MTRFFIDNPDIYFIFTFMQTINPLFKMLFLNLKIYVDSFSNEDTV